MIVKSPSLNSKQYIVLVITPDLPLTLQAPLNSCDQHKSSGDFQILVPKAKRGFEDEYFSSVSSRRGSGVINIKLPHRGNTAGVNYEVRGVEGTEFLCICNCKLKIDQVRLLEDVSSAAYSKTVQQLLDKKSDGRYPPALDPVKGIFPHCTIFLSYLVSQL